MNLTKMRVRQLRYFTILVTALLGTVKYQNLHVGTSDT